jgi:hypothetical protein
LLPIHPCDIVRSDRFPRCRIAAMWCPSCSADVAAELTADERRFLCTRCQTELGLTAATVRPSVTKPAAAERDARELLARWSADSLLDEPLRPVMPKDQLPASTVSLPIATAKTEPDAPSPEKIRRRVKIRREAASGATLAESSIVADQKEARPSRSGVWLSTVGLLAAYTGIGLITCGTALVIWSHYGGPATYAPSGWLINALGQMLFFLGLVNLVSGGLEQSASEVRDQLARLRTELQRLEARQEQSARRGRRSSRRDAA